MVHAESVVLNRKGLASAPKDWNDLNNQAFKGQIEIGDPAYSGTTLAMVAEGFATISAKLNSRR